MATAVLNRKVTMKKSAIFRNRYVVLSIAGMIVAFVAVFLAMRPTSLEDYAERLGHSLLDANGRRLMGMVSYKERKHNQYSVAGMNTVASSVIAPKLSGLKFVRFDHYQMSSEQLQSRLILTDGEREYPLELFVEREYYDGDENVVFYLNLTLKSLWKFEHLIREGLDETDTNYHRAIMRGIESDRKTLEQAGSLGGVSGVRDSDQLISWDVFYAFSEKSIRQAEGELQP